MASGYHRGSISLLSSAPGSLGEDIIGNSHFQGCDVADETGLVYGIEVVIYWKVTLCQQPLTGRIGFLSVQSVYIRGKNFARNQIVINETFQQIRGRMGVTVIYTNI